MLIDLMVAVALKILFQWMQMLIVTENINKWKEH